MSKHDINASKGYYFILDNYGLSVSEMFPIIYRVRKVGLEDCVDNLLGLMINHETTNKQKDCYSSLLFNLVRSCAKGYDAIFHSGNKNKYFQLHTISGFRHRSNIYYSGAKKFVEWMVKQGYVQHIKGKKDLHTGFLVFTDKFKKEVTENTMPIIKPRWDVVKLKSHFSNDTISFANTPEIKELKEFIEKYNDFMDRWEVHLNGKPLPSDIYRLFIDSFSRYGRFHGDYQTIPQADRRDITFDHHPTVELDIESCHLTILYSSVGIDASRIGVDLYCPDEIDFCVRPVEEEYSNCSLTRKDVKEFMMRMINCETRLQAVQALTSLEQLNCKFGKKHDYYNRVIDALIEEHEPIKHLFFRGLSMELMYDESEMMLEVLKGCVSEQLPVLPIHDSIICLEDNKQQVSNLMRDVFFLRWGVHCKIREK